MIAPSVRSIVLIASLAATSLASTVAAQAGPYDGSWSVTVRTSRGSCDAAYRYGVTISNGVVSGGGAGSMSGRVSPNGSVSVSVSGGAGSAHGSGRLSRNGGGGSWSGRGSSGACSGSWSAQRG
jgi:hypothetical protein